MEVMEKRKVNKVKMKPINRKKMRKSIRMRFRKNQFLRRKKRNSILKYMKKKLSMGSFQKEYHLKGRNVRIQ